MNEELPNKLIVSGKVIETFSYEKMPVKDPISQKRNCIRRTFRDYNLYPDTSSSRNKNSLRRSRMAIVRLANSNSDLTKFVTLTFQDKKIDLGETNYEFNKFIHRLRYLNGNDLKYIAVPEYQKREAIHYHLLLNVGYIYHQKLFSTWGHGFVKIKKIGNIHNLGLYISKYLRRDSVNSQLFGRRSYFTSQNINKPIVYGSANSRDASEVREIWENFKLYEISPIYDTIYDTKYRGKVHYRKYVII